MSDAEKRCQRANEQLDWHFKIKVSVNSGDLVHSLPFTPNEDRIGESEYAKVDTRPLLFLITSSNLNSEIKCGSLAYSDSFGIWTLNQDKGGLRYRIVGKEVVYLFLGITERGENFQG